MELLVSSYLWKPRQLGFILQRRFSAIPALRNIVRLYINLTFLYKCPPNIFDSVAVHLITRVYMLPPRLSIVLSALASACAQTLYLAGDSTMAKGGSGSGHTDGWGQYVGQYLTLPIVNKAVGGTSARSYTDLGLFTALINSVKQGDYVIIEFGHNDAHATVDNGNQDAVGDGYDTTAVVTNASGQQILIHSFPYYIQNAITALQAKGAIPIVSSMTPDNIWTGNVVVPGSRFVDYCVVIGQRTGTVFVDHNAYTAQAYTALGMTTVNTYYPDDHLHTSPAGANVVAEAFIRGLLCGSSPLKNFVNAAGKAVPNGCI